MHTVLSYVRTYEKFHLAYARALFLTLAALCLSFLGAYGYFLKSAAFSAARWEDDQAAIVVLSSEVSELESAYFAQIQSLGIKEANTLGLHETKSPLFVERGSDARLTFANGASGESR